MKTATQLKALIRNMAKEKKIDAQILLRNYMLERLLERISLSKYRYNFILKGGMLVAAMVGIDTRSTMDMDATIRDYPVTEEAVRKAFEDIIAIQLDDETKINIKSVTTIRDEAEYGGLRVSLEATFDGIRMPLKIDITTGDKITPKEIGYSFNLMFEERNIAIFAYNLETVLAEKIETIISRSTANTRMRDFYDVYILLKTQLNNFDNKLFTEALIATAKNRNSLSIMDESEAIIMEVLENKVMNELWDNYRRSYSYAEELEWKNVCTAVLELWHLRIVE